MEIAQQKRMEIKSGVYADVPDNEKDLLTLMLEAEEKGGVWTSEDELRVSIGSSIFLVEKCPLICNVNNSIILQSYF